MAVPRKHDAAGIAELSVQGTAGIIKWLTRIAENEMLDIHRRHFGAKRDRDRQVGFDDLPPGWREPEAGEPMPEEEASQAELQRIVDDAVARLSEDDRDVIMARTYYGGSWAEVAEQLGRSEEAARKLHARARVRLGRLVKKAMEGAGEEREQDDG